MSERPEGQAPPAWAWKAAMILVVRPRLWGVAVVQAGRLARPGWWRRWPPIPVPDPDYLRFRLQTAYGDPDRPPEPEDVISYLVWCRAVRRLR